MATVTYVIEGSFTSGGSGILYDLQLPIQTVQTNSGNTNIASTSTQPSLVSFKAYNYTKYGTNAQTLESKWFKGMANGSALLITRGTTDLSSTLETTNGFTIVNNTDLFGVQITAISKANPGVATFIGPGFNPGQGIPAFATGDQFKFSYITGSSGTDWAALNGQTFTLTKVTANTFSFGVDTSAYTGTYTANSGIAYRTQTASGTLIPPLNVADVGIRFGSAVLGNDGDVIYWEATISDDSRALGDIGA
jgi:hypothetical protein